MILGWHSISSLLHHERLHVLIRSSCSILKRYWFSLNLDRTHYSFVQEFGFRDPMAHVLYTSWESLLIDICLYTLSALRTNDCSLKRSMGIPGTHHITFETGSSDFYWGFHFATGRTLKKKYFSKFKNKTFTLPHIVSNFIRTKINYHLLQAILRYTVFTRMSFKCLEKSAV